MLSASPSSPRGTTRPTCRCRENIWGSVRVVEGGGVTHAVAEAAEFIGRQMEPESELWLLGGGFRRFCSGLLTLGVVPVVASDSVIFCCRIAS